MGYTASWSRRAISFCAPAGGYQPPAAGTREKARPEILRFCLQSERTNGGDPSDVSEGLQIVMLWRS
jgi:hypothetical protein